jgi:hypothetical protein
MIGEAVTVQVDGCLHACARVGGGECVPDATSPPRLTRSSGHGQNTSALTATAWSHSSARAYIATVAVTEADNIAVGTAREDFTAQAPPQSTHLARVSLEHRDDTARDADVVMHN